ncbi:NAD(P)/FAD-dependent oxidoreductase [Shewanella psychrotolerans]|uniref:NAD(P)/FAD-dependent oxidoreductase n=1 Tax=Shewanella psychrotolerans TaxID=2864206 RepID=UPI001C65A1A7|nr:FAD-binding oxidoreductase [Shewanella psychrotolerans]QYK00774.1 FAD-binding oxidoreductase [Shewanella psychrotolerans]
MESSLYQSLWFDTLGEPIEPRRSLTADIEADVAIIGAGYTGLWTAYYLKQKSPSLKIVVVDASVAGEGASGRNGGWLMGSFVGDSHYLAGLSGTGFTQAKQLIQSPVNEISAVLKQHHIDCDLVHRGNLRVAARYPEQLRSLGEEITLLHQQGFTEQDYRWVEGDELNQAISMRDGRAAIYTPHCATIHPLKLVRGLARIVESVGVSLYEQSPVTAFGDGLVKCEKGAIRADIIVPALEGYQAEVSSLGRYTMPLQSLLIATQPLTESQWLQIGLADRATFSDAARQVTYGQRSKDNRMVFGARGGYRFGGETQTLFAADSDAFAWRVSLMADIFPILKGVNITHRWGGTLAMARKFAPHAIFDKRNGVGLAGGYGGEGVGASNLFARTLSDLILERETELTKMPWAHVSEVKQVLTPWEPEPFRWLTYQLINKVFSWEERLCLQANQSSLQKRIAIHLAQRLDGLMH